jgi:hypothetical protein
MGHQPASGPHPRARPGRRAAGPGHAGPPDPSQRSERRRVNAAAVVVHFQDHRAGGSRYSHSRTDHDACLAADVGQRLVVSCHLPSELTHPVAAMVLADRQPCALAPEFSGCDGPSEPGQRTDPPVLWQAKIPGLRPLAHHPARHEWLASIPGAEVALRYRSGRALRMKPHPPLPAVSSAGLRGSSARRPRWHAIALPCLTTSVEQFQVLQPRGVAATLAVQRAGTRPGDRGTRTACRTGRPPFT